MNSAMSSSSYTSPQEASQPRTLYVGNLDIGVDEEFICTLFTSMGPVKSCKIIHEPGSDPYSFIEFVNHQDALAAITSMNQRICLGKKIRVNWASSVVPQQQNYRPDTSKHYHIFVGDLSPHVETTELREAFNGFGEISDCRVVKDNSTNKSRGYGFVSFSNKSDAENAIQMMNGSWLGNRAIRTNWATRKPSQKDDGYNAGQGGYHHRSLNYDDVFKQSSPNNCTVYCGGLCVLASTEDCLREAFEEFGEITDIRVFKEKGYAFIKFNSKDAACKAIVARHNSDIGGQPIKCSWGKEQEAPQQHSYQYDQSYQGMNYWYQGYPVENGYVGGGDYMNHMYAAAAAAAAGGGGGGQYPQQYYGHYSLPGVQMPQSNASGGTNGAGSIQYPPPASQQYSSH